MRRSPLAIALSFAACVEANPRVNAPDAAVLADSGLAEAGTTEDAADAAEPEDAAVPTDAEDTFADASTSDPRCVFNTTPPASPSLDPRNALPAARLEDLEACVAMDPARANTLVNAFLEEHRLYGSTAPLAGTGSALVLYRGDASNLTVSGSFDSWPMPGTRTFRNIAGTDLHVAEIPVGANDRHQYKLTRVGPSGVEWTTDPLNRFVVWDGIDQRNVGSFNNELFGSAHVFEKSVLYRFFIRDRDVFLQLPLAHFTGAQTMGVLYVHDGNEMLTRSGMQSVVDQTIAANRCDPLAVVYVALPNQNIRIDEYTFGTDTARGDAYTAMLADEVVPEVEPFIRTGNMPAQRGLAGASLGGLISFHGAWVRNDTFRLIGGQSSSFFWEDDEIIARFRDGPMIDARIYLDSGSPSDNSGVTREMNEVLEMRGYDHLHIEQAGATHDWFWWAQRFDELLEFLY